MAFTLSGTTITQTGTDTDLSGLSAITGVTTTSVDSDKKSYLMTGLRLKIDGTLTQDPFKEVLYFPASSPSKEIEISGTFNYGIATVVNGISRYSEDEGIFISGSTSSSNYFDEATSSVIVNSGGQFNWSGGKINVGSIVVFSDSSVIRIKDGVIDIGRRITATYKIPLDIKTSNIEVDGITGINGSIKFSNPSIDYAKIKNIKSIQMEDGIRGSADNVSIKNYTPLGNDYDLLTEAGKTSSIVNMHKTTPVLFSVYSQYGAAPNQSYKGIVLLKKQINITVTDVDNIPIQGVTIYSPDVDNGKRVDRNGLDSTASVNTTLTTDASGTAQETITTLIYNRDGWGSGRLSTSLQTNAYDYRVKDTDGINFKRDFYFRDAGFITKKIEINLIGVGVLDENIKLFKDDNYSNTATDLTIIRKADELYDLVRQAVSSDLTLEDDIITVTNTALVVKTGWTLASVNGGSGAVLDINNTTKIITAKLNDTGLQRTTKFDTLSGTIDSSLDSNTDMQYTKSNGKVSVRVDVILEAGATNGVFGVWLKSQGTTNRAGILTAPSGGTVDVTPGDEMYFVADAINAYRSQPVTFTVGSFGSVLTTNLRRIKKVDGTNLLPDSLLVAQKRIADMFIYNQSAARVDIKLPDNYATDERWDSTNNFWNFKTEDFWPAAYKAEQLQSSEASLIDPSIVTIDSYELILDASSALTFRQDATNVNCEINIGSFIVRRQQHAGPFLPFTDNINGIIRYDSGNLYISEVIVPASILTTVLDAMVVKIKKLINNAF